MEIRCIFCGRQKQQLTSAYRCADSKDCEEYLAYKNRPPVKVCIWFDAACQGMNKAEGTELGIGIYTTINGVESPEHCGIRRIGWGSVNDGEWTAFVYAMNMAYVIAKKEKKANFKIFGDSQVVIKAFNGDTKKVAAKFRKYRKLADAYAMRLGDKLLSVSWLPRDYNNKADVLSKAALQLEHETI